MCKSAKYCSEDICALGKGRGRVCLGSQPPLHTHLGSYTPGLQAAWTITFPPHGLQTWSFRGLGSLTPGPTSSVQSTGLPGAEERGAQNLSSSGGSVVGESQVPNGVDGKVLLSCGIWAAAPCHCKNRLRNIPSLADSKGTGGLERECVKLSMANSCKAQGIIMRKEERAPQEGVWDLNASPTPFRWQCEQALPLSALSFLRHGHW